MLLSGRRGRWGRGRGECVGGVTDQAAGRVRRAAAVASPALRSSAASAFPQHLRTRPGLRAFRGGRCESHTGRLLAETEGGRLRDRRPVPGHTGSVGPPWIGPPRSNDCASDCAWHHSRWDGAGHANGCVPTAPGPVRRLRGCSSGGRADGQWALSVTARLQHHPAGWRSVGLWFPPADIPPGFGQAGRGSRLRRGPGRPSAEPAQVRSAQAAPKGGALVPLTCGDTNDLSKTTGQGSSTPQFSDGRSTDSHRGER